MKRDRIEVLSLLMSGKKTKEAAMELGISYVTFMRHLKRHLESMNTRTTEQAAAFVAREKVKASLPREYHSLIDEALGCFLSPR